VDPERSQCVKILAAAGTILGWWNATAGAFIHGRAMLERGRPWRWSAVAIALYAFVFTHFAGPARIFFFYGWQFHGFFWRSIAGLSETVTKSGDLISWPAPFADSLF